TKKQCTLSRSSAEAEYRSMAVTICELKWISYLLRDFGVSVVAPIPLHCDNQNALHIMVNFIFHEHTKYLNINCHIVHNCYKDGFINPVFLGNKDQLADLFTKTLFDALFFCSGAQVGLVWWLSKSNLWGWC
ncbi:UNVERIFIED_CONTAM: hypothetical protein Sangu_2445800, partial [Sesamum angustifolium]